MNDKKHPAVKKKVPTHRPATGKGSEMYTPKAAETREDLHEGDADKRHQSRLVIVFNSIDENPKVKPQSVKK